MSTYNHQEIEKKWQKKWAETQIYKTQDTDDKPKYFVLDMFPYPSGAGLHVGHPKGYIATDVIARFKMLNGFNVLHPMGWDAFGLPAENYALKMKTHPRIATEQNVARFKQQLEILGLTYDWDREINTTDPQYYKWTQWIFLQMFKKGLAFESYEPINWCPSCKTGLANEDLENGKCERCCSEIEQKPMRQWVLKITDYAEKMLDGLKDLDWEDSIIQMQKNWIGRSEGAEIKFQVKSEKELSSKALELSSLRVFTTRPDTLFGATYMVLAPDHKLVEQLQAEIENYDEVKLYQEQTKNKTDLERTDLNKNKTGVELKGIKAINPANNEEIPIFIADYVLSGYGTGAIMAVPAHDERDFEFAQKYHLNIKEVVKGEAEFSGAGDKIVNPYTGPGILINSDFLDMLTTQESKQKMIEWLEEKGLGKKTINYKLKDWVFSRQRYWGEPIPIIHCEKCGAVPVPEDQLPVELPDVENYEPTGTGESPLANIDEWVNTTCPTCGGSAKRETNTMPQWAGSCWYYLRYIDPKNNENFADAKKEKYWMPVDLYVGGAEHATRHLIYARFWHRFLYDIGVVSTPEPFKKLQHVGLIMAEDGRKMSKRWGNVINPDDVVKEHGADTLRIYEMFMGPFDNAIAWNTKNLVGARRFLEKVIKLESRIKNQESETNNKIKSLLHKTIKKVTDDIENLRFNTAISAMMILVNEMEKQESVSIDTYKVLIMLLSPFAPHIAEELWQKTGHTESVFKEQWPQYDESLIKDEEIELIIQINGKLRDKITVSADISEEEAKEKALASKKIQKWLEGKEPKKVIFVKGKLVSIVI